MDKSIAILFLVFVIGIATLFSHMISDVSTKEEELQGETA